MCQKEIKKMSYFPPEGHCQDDPIGEMIKGGYEDWQIEEMMISASNISRLAIETRKTVEANRELTPQEVINKRNSKYFKWT